MITSELMSLIETKPEVVYFNNDKSYSCLGDYLNEKLHIGHRELEETCIDSKSYDEDLLWEPCSDFCLVVGPKNFVGTPDAFIIPECYDVIAYYKL